MNRRPSGFSLVELLVVMLVAGLMMAAVFQTLVVQQRGYRQQFSMTSARQSSRTTLDLLAVELRELSAADGDLVMATEDSLRFRSYRKVGIVCDVPNANKLHVEELGDAGFEAGDSLLVYQEEGDAWIYAPLTSTSSAAACPGGATARELNLGASLTDARPGAPVRGYRLVAFGLESLDGKWALARREQGKAAVSLVETLASKQQGGLRFSYIDSDGNRMTPPLSSGAARARVKRIEIAVRGASLGTGSAVQREYLDSLSLQVNLRGN